MKRRNAPHDGGDRKRSQHARYDHALLVFLAMISSHFLFLFCSQVSAVADCDCESFDQKSKLVNYLETNGIQTRNYFAGNILLHPAYTHLESWKNYPNATNVLGNVFFLGSSPTLTQDNLDYIKEIVDDHINNHVNHRLLIWSFMNFEWWCRIFLNGQSHE